MAHPRRGPLRLSDQETENPKSAMTVTGSSILANSGQPDRVRTPVGFKELLGAEMVTLIVGSNQEIFHVHKHLLCGKVEYFDRMFNGSFAEAQNNTATFPDDDSKVFDHFLRWVYDGHISRLQFIQSEDENGNEVWKQTWQCLHLYALADKLQVMEVMDRTLDTHIEGLQPNNLIPGKYTFEVAFTKVREHCSLKEFLIHKLCWAMTSAEWPKEEVLWRMTEYPDLTVLIVPYVYGTQAFNRATLHDPATLIGTCHFHMHEEVAQHAPCPWRMRR